MLIGQFLGTSAAEGVPAPFCNCPTCKHARRVGGKEIRLRSCFRLTDTVMIDLGADAVMQAMRYGELSAVNHVLVTHTHDDHLNPHMLMEAMWSRDHRETLHYYFTDKAYEIVEHWRASPWILKGKVKEFEEMGYVAFHRLEFGKRIELEGMGITPFRGNHLGNVGEHSAMYLVELPDGRALFYGLDSGTYFPETLQALSRHRIDIYISENSVGAAKDRQPHPAHLRLVDVKELADQLFAQGTLQENSILYLTHINHGSSHEENLQAVEELRFPIKTVVAYDGLKVL